MVLSSSLLWRSIDGANGLACSVSSMAGLGNLEFLGKFLENRNCVCCSVLLCFGLFMTKSKEL